MCAVGGVAWGLVLDTPESRLARTREKADTTAPTRRYRAKSPGRSGRERTVGRNAVLNTKLFGGQGEFCLFESQRYRERWERESFDHCFAPQVTTTGPGWAR